MGLNSTPQSDRIHIGFFGNRNAGKSSVVNAVTGQDLSVVSKVSGTTTDPVLKSMELLPMGPVVVIDTPGFDDEGELGALRVKKTHKILNKIDVAVLVVDALVGKNKTDEQLISIFKEKEINYILAYNKSDLLVKQERRLDDGLQVEQEQRSDDGLQARQAQQLDNELYISAKTGYQIEELKEKIATLSVTDDLTHKIIGDLISPLDFVVLVIPVDSAAPKGRLILPQQQTIRDVLESNATAIVVQTTQLSDTLAQLGKKPKLVVTDSQAFEKVNADTPNDILLTSFSILFARYKGDLELTVKGVTALHTLKDGDTVLICEGCTHHRQCDDIGTVKLPRWIKKFTNKNLNFEFTSGTGFPEDLTEYQLIIHCGACMLNEREVKYRMKCAKGQNVPITNYGIAIAYMHGILERSVEVFPDILAQVRK
ncbi:[FeFe] hydrogenase H-cluster maturation GTPase HydF [Lachnospiraceae bacterium ZAX-1]